MAFIEPPSPRPAPPRGVLAQHVRGAAAYEHPDDVLRDPWLDPEAKRAVLSSWASDANTVESWPTLRLWPGAARAVPVADVLQALRQLDETECAEMSPDTRLAAGGGV